MSSVRARQPDPERIRFGQRIDILIQRVGGVSTLARMAEVSESCIRKWRSGSSEPSRCHLVRLARETGADLAWLLSGDPTGLQTAAPATHWPNVCHIAWWPRDRPGPLKWSDAPTIAIPEAWPASYNVSGEQLWLVELSAPADCLGAPSGTLIVVDGSRTRLHDGSIVVLTDREGRLLRRIRRDTRGRALLDDGSGNLPSAGSLRELQERWRVLGHVVAILQKI